MTDWLEDAYQIHGHFHEGDAGLDIYMPKDIYVGSMVVRTGLIGLGIAVEPDMPFMIVPRSSMATKTGLSLANSIGIIDKGYRGELKAVFDNVCANPTNIMQGDRLLQIVAPTLEPITFELVDELSETARGDGGFGSTDKS
jgi:dUTP pyrophosphatase